MLARRMAVRDGRAGPGGWPADGRYDDDPIDDDPFDDDDRLAGEKIYYDRATVLRQLGIFLEPDHGLGRIATIIMHPLTVARAFLRTAQSLSHRRSCATALAPL